MPNHKLLSGERAAGDPVQESKQPLNFLWLFPPPHTWDNHTSSCCGHLMRHVSWSPWSVTISESGGNCSNSRELLALPFLPPSPIFHSGAGLLSSAPGFPGQRKRTRIQNRIVTAEVFIMPFCITRYGMSDNVVLKWFPLATVH